MKPLLTGAAVAALFAGLAVAQTSDQTTTTAPPETTQADAAGQTLQTAMQGGAFLPRMQGLDIRASDFIGKALYATGTPDPGLAERTAEDRRWSTERMFADDDTLGLRQDWEEIGEVSDVVLSQDGQVQAVLADIGGFLGLGEHTVAIRMDQIRFAPAEGTEAGTGAGGAEVNLDDFMLVVAADRAALEQAPDYEQVAAGDEGGMAGVTGAEGPGTGGPIEREGFLAADEGYMTTETLTSARVYDANNEWVGDIGELVLDDQGQITQAVIDVGGFLGIGEKPVAIPMDQLQILRAAEGEEVRAYVMLTEDQLEELPAFDR